MPEPLEEIALRHLVKHPAAFLLYALCIGIGWLAPRLFPDDCQKANARLEKLYDSSLKRGDSIQSTKDQLYERYLVQRDTIKYQKQKDRTTDSLLRIIGTKAGVILKEKKP